MPHKSHSLRYSLLITTEKLNRGDWTRTSEHSTTAFSGYQVCELNTILREFFFKYWVQKHAFLGYNNFVTLQRITSDLPPLTL